MSEDDGRALVARKPARHLRPLRRRWVAALCVGVLAGGIDVTWSIQSRAQPCRAVRAMIDFNRTTQASLQAKTRIPAAGSHDELTVPADADYRYWADGMRQRAGRVGAPGLAVHAHRAADLAQQSLTVMKQMQEQAAAQDPLSRQVPASAYTFAVINREFTGQMRALQDACPA